MESSASEELQALSAMISRLASQRDEAREALAKARREISDLAVELELTREELHARTLDVEFLSVSHKLAEGPQALADARRVVRGMIARVDRALDLLKSDPAM